MAPSRPKLFAFFLFVVRNFLDHSHFGSAFSPSSLPSRASILVNLRKLSSDNNDGPENRISNDVMSRRNLLKKANSAIALIGLGSFVSNANAHDTTINGIVPVPVTNRDTPKIVQQPKLQSDLVQSQPQQQSQPKQRIEPINIEQVAKENKVNITLTLENERSKVYIDRSSFEKLKERSFPRWLPEFLKPKPQSIGLISDAQLLFASAIAGAFTEIIRSSILYPIMTIKTRVQAITPSREASSLHDLSRKFATSISTQIERGDLYAGFLPSLISSVPAAGVYYAVSDVMKKEIRLLSSNQLDDLSVILLAVFVADVVSLAVRTPAVTFSVRRQAAKTIVEVSHDESQKSDFVARKDWWHDLWKDCWRQLPTIIITDLPYLFLKISLLKLLAQGNENIAQYGVLNIFAACVASGLTTPFDVARTRILVDSDRDASNNRVDGGSDEGVIQAMERIVYEGGDAGEENGEMKIQIRNLYAGWFERVSYFGIGIAWLDPIRILGYYALRDILLLELYS